jgi:hypothetical protein
MVARFKGEVLEAVCKSASSEQQSSVEISVPFPFPFNGSGLVGKSQCFWVKIGMFMNAV